MTIEPAGCRVRSGCSRSPSSEALGVQEVALEAVGDRHLGKRGDLLVNFS
jgi:hypothetical protein